MAGPVLTFDGMNSAQSGCSCLPPDSDGDVGPNHYINAVNTSIKIFDKSGNPLNGVNGTTFDSFFHDLGGGNPCGNSQNGGPQNRGDPFVFYDHLANRWVVTDIAFPSFPGTSFWECIGVSKTGDPVSGGWWLYALQVDPAHPNRLGDYPKFALWHDAYFLTMNEFTNDTTFNGVRVYALDRASMINGGLTHAIGFTIDATTLGDAYSLVPAGFRTGNPPPTGRDEMLLAIDSPLMGGVTLTKVKGWKFHVDFGTPANSTLGIGVNHSPNAEITVSGFVDAFTNTTTNLVPQLGTSQRLDTLGDKIMTPLVYQNRNGTESLWASHTVCTDQNCTGPTAIRWYQFNVTGGNFPATPVQQQSWTNGNDGLWRWMPSIAADQNGNVPIGYSTSSPAQFPSIRYAGRLVTDALNNLPQGEAIMTVGGGAQLSGFGRWGDYSMTTIDPSDGISFWHVNEYYVTTSSASWVTRIGKFQFGAAPPPPPPACVAGSEKFTDVPASNPFCPWIEELARRGITGGCAPNLYCPGDPVTRQQMAVFLVKSVEAAKPVQGVLNNSQFVQANAPFSLFSPACPAGTRAASGGFRAASDAPLTVAASQPSNGTLNDVSGVNVADRWLVQGMNSATAQNYVVYVECVPISGN
jgi:hypothetical protein